MCVCVCFHFQPLKHNKYRIFKSRYDSIDSYLSPCGEKYNDIDLTIDEDIYAQLLDAGKRNVLKSLNCTMLPRELSRLISVRRN